jgi:hypothetical protein
MLAYFLLETREWRERRMRKALLASAVSMAVIAAASVLQPLPLVFAATLAFLILGWSEGNRYQSLASSRRILLGFPAGAAVVVEGKILASIASWAFALLVLSPPLVLSAIAWGVDPLACASCLLAWLAAYVAAVSVGFFSSLVFSRSEGLLGVPLLILWLVVSSVNRLLAPANPFIQVWDFLKGEGELPPYLGIAAIFLASALFFAASVSTVSRLRKAGHE